MRNNLEWVRIPSPGEMQFTQPFDRSRMTIAAAMADFLSSASEQVNRLICVIGAIPHAKGGVPHFPQGVVGVHTEATEKLRADWVGSFETQRAQRESAQIAKADALKGFPFHRPSHSPIARWDVFVLSC